MEKYEYSVIDVVNRIHCTVRGTWQDYSDLEYMKKASEWLSWRVREGWDDSDDTQYASLLRCMALITLDEAKKNG